jgi:aminodeoxyfutalosine deaminase
MILSAAWVAPVSAPPIRRGYVEIENGRIVGVGSADQLASAARARASDLGDAILTPGLVNAHTHLELTVYAGKLPPAPFWPWIRDLAAMRSAPDHAAREELAAGDGARQSLRAGVTCVGDISRENVAWKALKTIPIRKICFAELLSLADSPPRNPQELRAAVADIREDELLTAGITPHAPYTVPQAHLQAAIALAAELNRPWCTHWAETREEVAFLAGQTDALPTFLHALLDQCDVRSPGLTATAYLDRCVGACRPGILAHVNYVDDADIARLAAAGHAVVYCPRAHRFFGHRPHPFRRLQVAGVTVAIGTDSLASNESLSILAELRHLRQNVADSPPADALLRMATLDAARALRLDARIGSLELGKAADLAAFSCPANAPDPLAALIDAAPDAVGVWVAGKRVV